MATCRFKTRSPRSDSRYALAVLVGFVWCAILISHRPIFIISFAGLVDRLPHLGRHESARAERILHQGAIARVRAAHVRGRLVAGAGADGHLYDQGAGRSAQLVEGHCARQVDHGHHCDGLFHASGGTMAVFAFALYEAGLDSHEVSIRLSMLFPSQITTQALLLFSCKRMGLRPEDMYLNADLSQQCWTPKHIGWAVGLGVRVLGKS